MSTSPHTITQLLRAIESGEEQARAELFTLLYHELHDRAARLAHKQPQGMTLQATALVHEVYLKLVGVDDPSFVDRNHFLACAAKAMRSVLVDHARRTHANRGLPTQLDTIVAAFEERAYDIEKLDLALTALGRMDPEMARAVELRFFGGLSEEDVARVVDVPLRTLQRRWKVTREWLRRRCDES